jgi:pimeloyl-ACP methyl ester carboxylesterase
MSASLSYTSTELGSERIACLESKGSGPTLVMCHSNSTSAELFRPLLEGSLGAHYQGLALDFPGHGRSAFSPRAAESYSLPGLAQLLVEFIARRRLRRYVLVGHSLGGHAILEALDGLEGAAGVLLIGAPPINLDSLAQVFQPDPTQGLLFQEKLSATDAERFALALVRPALVPAAIEEALRRSISGCDPAFRSRLGASLAKGHLRDETLAVTRSRVPLLFLHGSEDPFIRSAAYRAVSAPQPWREGVITLRGHGHSPQLSAPLEVAELIAAFVQDCPETA